MIILYIIIKLLLYENTKAVLINEVNKKTIEKD